jgi:hypothetical protein
MEHEKGNIYFRSLREMSQWYATSETDRQRAVIILELIEFFNKVGYISYYHLFVLFGSNSREQLYQDAFKELETQLEKIDAIKYVGQSTQRQHRKNKLEVALIKQQQREESSK